MMKHILKIHFHTWLIVGMMALALLTLAFQNGDEVDPAHCYPCVPPTHTPTPTPTRTPTPVLQSCQISEIYFNEEFYTGETITATVNVPLNVTVKVVDQQGQILIGANVDATVTRQELSTQAVNDPIPLPDQSGTYDGVYTPENIGLYTFKFLASDFSGSRFLPCEVEALVRVVPDSDPSSSCEIALTSDRPEYTLGDTINLTATLTQTVCTNGVTATIRLPGEGIVTRQLTGPGNICTGNYTPLITGTFTISATANSPGGMCTSNTITPGVNATPPPTLTPIVAVDPPNQTIDLCGSGPDTTSTITVRNVTNLKEVRLEVSYDPTYIQVIDAFRRPRPPVQVRPIPPCDQVSRNEVDTGRGKIYFETSCPTPVNGQNNLVGVDWRFQGRTGSPQIQVSSVLTGANGNQINHLDQSGTMTIIVGPPCRTGTATLQGRTDHSGVIVTDAVGGQTQTYPNGLFAIAAGDHLSFTFPGYLSAQVDVPPSAAVGLPEGEVADLGAITLLAGDVTGDNRVNILDLATLAQHYLSAEPIADLNADGVVNILDLALVAGNYQQQGPLTTWK
jgi:hypothetical protein